MKREKLKTNVSINKLFVSFTLFLFALISFRVFQLSMSTTVDGKNLRTFSNSIKTVKSEVKSSRGSIYDSNGNILAQNVSSYTVIAYLSEKKDDKDYVIDKALTAKSLAPLINMTEEKIIELLSKDLYQVELGPGGRNLSQSLKDQIELLDLPGIDFVRDIKRYYPNGNYASYLIGYSKDIDGIMTGEMGIEKEFDEYLNGKDGYREFQADLYGTKIPNTKEIVKEAVDGNDVHLTIDTNIQLFAEQSVKKLAEESNPEWATVIIANAKTGAILGTTSIPSFDPNKKDITNYLNPVTSIAYEPGSTMKIYTYMAALEAGRYNGLDTYQSGTITFTDYVIKDWNNKGWGVINYDQGFAYSSNVGVSTMYRNGVITRSELKDYFLKMGFGSTTSLKMPNEVKGKIDFKYEVEVANATFGQGITTTAIQNIQALTAISNDGMLLKPYLVDKVLNKKGEILFHQTKEEISRVASTATITKIKELMKSVTNGDGTGRRYNVPQYDVIGKTGTAQIFDSKSGRYLEGMNDYTRVFAGMFPADDPQVIIYYAVSKGSNVVNTLPNAVRDLVESTGKYLGINQDTTSDFENVSHKLPSYINKSTNEVIKELQSFNINPIVIGNGNKVINQYPNLNSVVTYSDKIFLLTNSNELLLPNFTGWSYKDFITFTKLTNLKYEIEGTGYVTSQTLKQNTVINGNDILKVTLEKKVIPE